ncbi:hypothetical protein RNJ44_02638 [Nakaseomyces bracarensis]|uniref:LisH domain-containing protein n=1 Tax=Nakaseomyces bracarensis TaxID=273131 RepID=A0ABR4NZT6_9SACH
MSTDYNSANLYGYRNSDMAGSPESPFVNNSEGSTPLSGIVNKNLNFGKKKQKKGRMKDADQERYLVSDAMAKNSRQLLFAHIYNYLIRNKFYATASDFLKEVDIPLSTADRIEKIKGTSGKSREEEELEGEIPDFLLKPEMLLNSSDTFLVEWWEIFRTLYGHGEETAVDSMGNEINQQTLQKKITAILPTNKPAVPPPFSNIPSNFMASAQAFQNMKSQMNYGMNDLPYTYSQQQQQQQQQGKAATTAKKNSNGNAEKSNASPIRQRSIPSNTMDAPTQQQALLNGIRPTLSHSMSAGVTSFSKGNQNKIEKTNSNSSTKTSKNLSNSGNIDSPNTTSETSGKVVKPKAKARVNNKATLTRQDSGAKNSPNNRNNEGNFTTKANNPTAMAQMDYMLQNQRMMSMRGMQQSQYPVMATNSMVNNPAELIFQYQNGNPMTYKNGFIPDDTKQQHGTETNTNSDLNKNGKDNARNMQDSSNSEKLNSGKVMSNGGSELPKSLDSTNHEDSIDSINSTGEENISQHSDMAHPMTMYMNHKKDDDITSNSNKYPSKGSPNGNKTEEMNGFNGWEIQGMQNVDKLRYMQQQMLQAQRMGKGMDSVLQQQYLMMMNLMMNQTGNGYPKPQKFDANGSSLPKASKKQKYQEKNIISKEKERQNNEEANSNVNSNSKATSRQGMSMPQTFKNANVMNNRQNFPVNGMQGMPNMNSQNMQHMNMSNMSMQNIQNMQNMQNLHNMHNMQNMHPMHNMHNMNMQNIPGMPAMPGIPGMLPQGMLPQGMPGMYGMSGYPPMQSTHDMQHMYNMQNMNQMNYSSDNSVNADMTKARYEQGIRNYRDPRNDVEMMNGGSPNQNYTKVNLKSQANETSERNKQTNSAYSEDPFELFGMN